MIEIFYNNFDVYAANDNDYRKEWMNDNDNDNYENNDDINNYDNNI